MNSVTFTTRLGLAQLNYTISKYKVQWLVRKWRLGREDFTLRIEVIKLVTCNNKQNMLK